MKNVIFSLILTIGCFYAGAQTETDTLTNEKVVMLCKIGLEPSVVISKIQTSHNIFDVSTDGLIDLSSKGVPAEVINEMINKDTETKLAIANQKDLNDPLTMREAGIYYYNPQDSINPIRRVDPTVISGTKSGGFGTALAQRYTYGIAKNKIKSSLSGENSNLQIGESSPEFYFYFENSENFNSDNWFFATATSPNEFVLVRLVEKKGSREMIVANSNAYNASAGIPEKDKIPFNYEQVAEGVYRVTFSKKFRSGGEYCFLYASSTPSSFNNNKVFDFGILYNMELDPK